MKKSSLMKCLLCVALLLASVICPLVTKAEEPVVAEDIISSETFATAEYDVAEYRSSTPYTYPKKEGYIFAGWYTDEACTEDTVFTGTSGKAYAKFVDGDILGVKCQIEKDTKSTAETTNLRIVTSVGSDMYEKVGFKVEFEGKDPFYTSIDTVYKTMDGWVNGSNKSYAPHKLFSIGSKYLAGCTVLGFPNKDFDKNITITARWKTLDGTTVEGGMKRFSIKDVIKVFDYDGEGTQPVAKVGEEYCATFAEAVSKANDSTTDVTIQLLRDVTIEVPNADDAVVINNAKGKNITIDGCGYTLDVISTKHAILIHQESGTVTIQNCNIEHSGVQMLMRIGANGSEVTTDELTVNLSNIDIESAGTYGYCLIGTQGPQIFNVNMTDVNVDWDKANTQAASAFVRCGGTTAGQTLKLTMTDCVVDVTDADLTRGIYVHTTVTGGSVNLYNTDIITSGADTYTNKVANVTINYDAYCTFTKEDGSQAKIGDTPYSTFAEAVAAANDLDEDVTIQLLRDVTIDVPTAADAVEINNANGRNITIDGCGYTLDVISTKHAIRIHQASGTVTIQNCNIEHSGVQMLMRIGDGSYEEGDTEYNVTFKLRDVNIASSGTYQYCLIGTQDQGAFNLNMANVTVDWIETDNTQAARAFVRCGNSGYTQTVNLNMTGSTIDVSDAALTQGAYIYRYADVTVTSDENTRIPTAEGISGYTKEVLGKQAEYLEALDFANASKEDVTIKFIDDITYQFTKAGTNDAIINNVYGKNVTIDGNGQILETSSNYSAYPDLRIHQTDGTVTIKDLTIEHSGKAMLLRVGDNAYDDRTKSNVTVNLNDVDITSTSTYGYCLVATQELGTFNLNMTAVTAKWTEATSTQAARAFIRCGIDKDCETLVGLSMTECSINVSGAAKAQGIYIVAGATVNETRDANTTISTAADAYTNKGTYILNGVTQE